MALLDALFLDPAPFETWVAVRSAKGSGTLNDPYGVTTAADFDGLMNSLPATLVHLGPGTFFTTGYSDEAGAGWQIQPGTRIVGAGMGETTLQLVNASVAQAQYYGIGHSLTKVSGGQTVPNPVDFCEVSDLTLDANLGAMSALVACGGIRLMGNHVKVRSVRVINWGSKSSSKPGFVIALLTGDRSVSQAEMIDVGMESCVADSPASSGVSTTNAVTVLHVGGKQAGEADAEAFGKGPFIRNCFVDCGALTNPLTYEIRGLSMGWCRSGILEGNQIHNTKVGGPYQDLATIREIVVRNNFFKNVVRGPFFNFGSLNTSIGTATLSKSGNIVTATTSASDHKFQVGDKVSIVASPTTFSGVYQITGVPQTNQFTFLSSATGTPTSASSIQKVFAARNILVENNVIELATGTAGLIAINVNDDGLSAQSPDYVNAEAIIRSNKILYLDGQLDPTWSGYGIEVSGVKNAIIRDNVVECGPANPVRNFRCNTVRYFNNKSPAGALIQGYNGDNLTTYSELETEADDALLLTLM